MEISLSEKKAIQEDLSKAINKDMSKQRKALHDNLKNIGNEKKKEHERQVEEGFENAPVTEQENKQFAYILLTTEESEPHTEPGTTNDKGQEPVYDVPWTSYLETPREAATKAPGHLQFRRKPEDTFGNLQDNQNYQGRRPSQLHRKLMICKIL